MCCLKLLDKNPVFENPCVSYIKSLCPKVSNISNEHLVYGKITIKWEQSSYC
jgi:hypothetical protein